MEPCCFPKPLHSPCCYTKLDLAISGELFDFLGFGGFFFFGLGWFFVWVLGFFVLVGWIWVGLFQFCCFLGFFLT